MRLWIGCLFAMAAFAAPKWNVAYFHDEKDSQLTLIQLVFPSERRGIAIGVLADKGRLKPMALVTADGGKKWDMVPLREEPVYLTCATDALCWLATQKGVWITEEAGRNWRKVSDRKGILTLHFDSATHGFAAGTEKSVWETNDGGKVWAKLSFTDEVAAKAEHAAFHTMGFAGQFGLIAGTSRPPRRDDMSILPPWMEPEMAARKRDWPNLVMLAESRDAGKTWKTSSASVFGQVSQLEMDPSGFAIALFEFGNTFEFPSEVSRIDFRTGRMASVYRKKDHAVTDLAYLPNRSLVVAGIESTALRSLGLPGKVSIKEAAVDSKLTVGEFGAMAVDYRAVARHVQLARTPEGQLWAITDAGMILRLDR